MVVKIGHMEPIDNLNPFIGWSDSVYELYYITYQRLGGRNLETVQPAPGEGTFKSWEVSPDGLIWTCKLNEGMTWHDGEPVTAEDVAFTINYIIDNDMSAFTTATQFIDKAVVVDPSRCRSSARSPRRTC